LYTKTEGVVQEAVTSSCASERCSRRTLPFSHRDLNSRAAVCMHQFCGWVNRCCNATGGQSLLNKLQLGQPSNLWHGPKCHPEYIK